MLKKQTNKTKTKLPHYIAHFYSQSTFSWHTLRCASWKILDRYSYFPSLFTLSFSDVSSDLDESTSVSFPSPTVTDIADISYLEVADLSTGTFVFPSEFSGVPLSHMQRYWLSYTGVQLNNLSYSPKSVCDRCDHGEVSLPSTADGVSVHDCNIVSLLSSVPSLRIKLCTPCPPYPPKRRKKSH